MVNPSKPSRAYSLPDAQVIQKGRILHSIGVQDLSKFTEVDPDITSEWFDGMQSSLNQADSFEQDSAVVDEIATLTNDIQQIMNECHAHVKKHKYFIQKAFPGNERIQDSFGIFDYQSVRNSEVYLIRFFNNLKEREIQHSTELQAAGLTEGDITLTGTLLTRLIDADKAQETAKQNRLLITDERINLFNKVWEYISRLNKLSKIVFADDYTKLKQYQLSHDTHSTPEEGENG